jgi:hypothetical protein
MRVKDQYKNPSHYVGLQSSTLRTSDSVNHASILYITGGHPLLAWSPLVHHKHDVTRCHCLKAGIRRQDATDCQAGRVVSRRVAGQWSLRSSYERCQQKFFASLCLSPFKTSHCISLQPKYWLVINLP